MIDKTRIHNILFITLSNIGDVVLTLPTLGVLEREFPQAKITVMVGPGAKEIFANDPAVSKVIAYDKHTSFLEKLRLGLRLKKRKFDLVVDLRFTLYPIIINAPQRTSLFKKGKGIMHKRCAHLERIAELGINIDAASYNLYFSEDDKIAVKEIFNKFDIMETDKPVAVAPGAKSHTKRWTISGFAKVCQAFSRELGVKVFLVGDDNDKEIASQIISTGLSGTYNITGETSLLQLAYLLSCCKLLITNDSAPLHLSDIVNTPCLAIFGPTNHKKYGPLLKNSTVARKALKCSPCEKAQCIFNLECMKDLSADEVFEQAKKMLAPNI